jgi:hypothetical protein
MKKRWIPLVFAIFLLLAPVAGADDGSVQASLEEVIDQLVAWLTDELGLGYPPHGATAQPGDQPELGLEYPPGG